MNKGTVYWFTGLSGAGKTTISRLFCERLSKHYTNVIFLDGDMLREMFGNDLGHSRDQRTKSAMRNSRLCKMLSDQGINVICATISMFHECQRWNREHITFYKEIYIQVPIEVLISRDQKQLYSRALSGEIQDVMGIDIEIEEPESPDLTIYNSGDVSPEILIEKYFENLTGIKEKSRP